MTSESESPIVYLPPEGGHAPARFLVEITDEGAGDRFVFFDRIEIGRFKPDRQRPGHLLIRDATVSSRHCVLTQDSNGRCFVRDISRNGTRVDGRRLSPNLRTEIQAGQLLSFGRGISFRLEGKEPVDEQPIDEEPETHAITDITTVTVLVGDITNYTTMVQQVDSHELESSVSRVFQHLEAAVLKLGGTVKEFQGDAILAFWEEGSDTNHAIDACIAALALDRAARSLAEDPDTWRVNGFPLRMDWALATGKVAMHGHGGGHAVGLSMVGEPIVLAFRMEKILGEKPGRIIVCPQTRRLGAEAFRFEDLGEHRLKGFDRPWKLFALHEK